MSNSRMVDAVNRLVGTLLTGPGEVFLPGVGSLYAERSPAHRVSKKTVVPPCRMVLFSSQQRGVSLVDEIAETAKVAATQAEEIYQIWLSRARKDETLTIEGVGELKFKNFTLAPEFDVVLNPQGHEPVRINFPKHIEWPLWIGVVAIFFSVLFGGAHLLDLCPFDMMAQKKPVPQIAALTVVEEVVAEEIVATDSTEVIAAPVDSATLVTDTVVAVVTPEVPVEVIANSESERTLKSGRRYVVLGVFSTLENALRAARNAAKEQTPCSIYAFGNKFMVSPFESDQTGACAEFIRAHSERFPDLWTHAAR